MIAVRRFTGAILLMVCAAAGWWAGALWRSQPQVREVPVPELIGTRHEGIGMLLARTTLAQPAGPTPDVAGVERGARAPGSSGERQGTDRGAGVPVVRIFGDYECPACQALERLTGDSLRVLARAGRIRLVYHHAPLRTHRWGGTAAETAYCALDTGAGWSVHAALYRTAPQWSRAAEPARSLVQVAVRAGADEDAMTDCVSLSRAADRVRRDRDLASRLQVSAVPAVFLDGARVEFRSFRALLRHVSRRAAGS